jgi:hypothetical protein
MSPVRLVVTRHRNSALHCCAWLTTGETLGSYARKGRRRSVHSRCLTERGKGDLLHSDGGSDRSRHNYAGSTNPILTRIRIWRVVDFSRHDPSRSVLVMPDPLWRLACSGSLLSAAGIVWSVQSIALRADAQTGQGANCISTSLLSAVAATSATLGSLVIIAATIAPSISNAISCVSRSGSRAPASVLRS